MAPCPRLAEPNEDMRFGSATSGRVICRFALIASIAVLAGGCGAFTSDAPEKTGAPAAWLFPPRPIAGLHQRTVGDGAHGSVLLREKGAPVPDKMIVFLHGWLALPPFAYGDFLRHLAAQGNAIVYPVIQDARTKPEGLLANALAGIREGLRAAPGDSDSVVAIGFVTGAALAADYAAEAPRLGLPSPRGILAIFPGRRPGTGVVSPADLSRIPGDTLLSVISGPADPVPGGEAEARLLLRGASQVPRSNKTHIQLAAMHDRVLWAVSDRLIAEARAPG